MSSARSPDLRLELRTDCRVVAMLLAWLGLTIACIWWAALPPMLAILATVGASLLALPVIRSQIFTGRRAGVTLIWSADGRWHFHPVAGTSQELELSPVSRGFPGGVSLVFRAVCPLRWVLLLRREGDQGAVRRVNMRLNLEWRRPGETVSGVRGPEAKSAGGS